MMTTQEPWGKQFHPEAVRKADLLRTDLGIRTLVALTASMRDDLLAASAEGPEKARALAEDYRARINTLIARTFPTVEKGNTEP